MTGTLSEFGLIAKYFAPLATHPGALGLGDDACLLPDQAGRDLVVTADLLTAGVHFIADVPGNFIAAKALRTNLSDLAAKGAEPVGYLLSLALPHAVDEAWLKAFAGGLADDQAEFGLSLLGGDTTATSGPLTIAITALGHVPRGAMIRRSGAQPGDHVFVSGTIGDAGAGLRVLQGAVEVPNEWAIHPVSRYWRPSPRLSLGWTLRLVASAALDVSDGLIADLDHIGEQSGVRIVVEAGRVPLSASVRKIQPGLDGVVQAVTDGDDYEIAFTAADPDAVAKAVEICGVPVTRIGRVEAGQGIALVDGEGNEIPVQRPGFTHF